MPKAAKEKAPAKTKKAAPAKKVKDKNAPKRGMSSFMLFSQKNRPEIKSENPDAKFGDLGRLVGAAWKELSEEDKVPYVELAVKDKARYERENLAYVNKTKAATRAATSGDEEGESEEDDAAAANDDEDEDGDDDEE